MTSTAAITASTADKLRRARLAASAMAQLSAAQKNAVLERMATAIRAREAEILAANARDLAASGSQGAMRDRLLLNPRRIAEMVEGMRAVAALDDPVGRVLTEWTRPNGLHIRKITVPLGVVGVIYESRPNVTVDAAALAFKAGNAVVLRGGREALRSNEALAEILSAAQGVPEGAIELLDARSRDSAEELMRARDYVDVLIPRGGPGLISFVAENATVPVIETGAGNCHIFVDRHADLTMAAEIIINAKTQRPSVCNAAEKVLIDEHVAPAFVPQIVAKLLGSGVEVRADQKTRELAGSLAVRPATPEDWPVEYLCLRIGVRIVSGLDEAIEHINRFSTRHSESIITADAARAEEFLRRVDSAVVYWNASTRFTDGAEFGFGAEMGISTQKLHCRGPFALAELTSTKYEVRGAGQVRQ